MAGSKLRTMSTDFAVEILQLCDCIRGHHALKLQLERSGTSIGANIREANYAHSRADFIAKLHIALKECYETEYWLELLTRAQLAPPERLHSLAQTCGTLRRLLIASLNTAKGRGSDL